MPHPTGVFKYSVVKTSPPPVMPRRGYGQASGPNPIPDPPLMGGLVPIMHCSLSGMSKANVRQVGGSEAECGLCAHFTPSIK